MIDGVKKYGQWLTIIVWTLRVLIGAVFIVSGLAKCIDIYGFVFKIEEYLSVWGMSVPRSVVTLSAIFLSGGEFMLGLSLATGIYRRVVPVLLLAMMAVMTPLTLYLWILNPVSDCGCFGDFLKISNAATFWKNVVLTAAIIYLLMVNRKVKGLYAPYLQWMVAVVGVAYLICVSLYGLVVQPMVDFRSFPAGSMLVNEDGADDTSVKFIYEKEGTKAEFDIDNLPDSTWTFVDRVQEKASERTELIVSDDEGDDVTTEVIHSEGPQLLIVIPTMARADLSYTYLVNELQRSGYFDDGQIVELVSARGDDMERWRDRAMADLPIYSAEETVLKELSRGDVSAVYLKDGVIQWKRTLSSIDLDLIKRSDVGLDVYALKTGVTFLTLTLIFVGVMVLLFIFDRYRDTLRTLQHIRFRTKASKR